MVASDDDEHDPIHGLDVAIKVAAGLVVFYISLFVLLIYIFCKWKIIITIDCIIKSIIS